MVDLSGTLLFLCDNYRENMGRKIRLTPTTKNQILTLIHELSEDLVKIKGRTGQERVQNVDNDEINNLKAAGAQVTQF